MTVDYAEDLKAKRARWLTPADEAHIAAEVRQRYPYIMGEALEQHIKGAADKMALDMSMSSDEIPHWASHGLRMLTDLNVTVKRTPHGASPGTMESFAEKTEEMLQDYEAEARLYPEYPVDAVMHALARRWVAVTPYTVFRFYLRVVEAAADAAREVAEDLMFGDSPSSIADTTAYHAKDWLKAWQKEPVR